ncbi:MAG: Npt1/Npt2 family nucleotide transporter [Rickettsiales bacterium]
MSFFNSAKQFLWPIERWELKKFLPMTFMMFCILFNYNALRSIKDSLVVPNIGAEAINFIKFYCVVPTAIIFMVVYAKMTNVMRAPKIFYILCMFFLAFFLLFAFVFYPNQEFFHPDQSKISSLENSKINFMLFSIDAAHFKWFLRIYSKWTYALFYIIAELWGSAMLMLSFWQFANHITSTSQAKRFYPMFGFLGNIALIIAGGVIKYLAVIQKNMSGINVISDSGMMIKTMLTFMSLSIIVIMWLYNYMQVEVLTDSKYFSKPRKKTKPKLSIVESFKVIFSSKYLGYIVVLVFCYGMSINLVEGPWKSKVRELYPNTNDYAYFMGSLNQYTGLASMIFMIIGANFLRRFSWSKGAIITPLIIFFTGLGFFSFVVFDELVFSYVAIFMMINPVFIAVYIGTIQNVLSKGIKYAFFDPTKEMAYIPIDDELKTKGKAAVDVVGARLAKSFGAFIQASIFSVFPSANYNEITPYLMVVFVIICFVWLLDVNFLNREYKKSLKLEGN